jgi:SH3 domain-containing YSC84-like protein 1
LEEALKPHKTSIPTELFELCAGIVLISVVEVGFVFSGNVGTGIILRHTRNADGTQGWSLPSACGLTGLGYGLIAGASLKDILIFVMDEYTLNSMTTNHGLKLGAQGELTLGTIGRTAKMDMNFSSKGFGTTISIAYSKGLFGGISLEGSVVGVREISNIKFYGKDVSPMQILNGVGVTFPEGKVTLLDEVYDKLNKLAAGVEISEPTTEFSKIEAAKEEADKAADSIKDDPDIVHVDVMVEAAKEGSMRSDGAMAVDE